MNTKKTFLHFNSSLNGTSICQIKHQNFLASRLKEKNCLKPEAKISAFRSREATFLPYFAEEENIMYRYEFPGFVKQIELEFRPDSWLVFIDSSVRSLKCV